MTDLLDMVKVSRGVEDENSDELFQRAIDRATDDILNYIHHDELPKKLESTLIAYVNDLLSELVPSAVDLLSEDARVTSVKVGNTTVDKMSTAEVANLVRTLPSYINKYKTTLHTFRKLL